MASREGEGSILNKEAYANLTLARLRAGVLKNSDLTDEERQFLDIWEDIVEEDPKLKNSVGETVRELETSGVKVPLFTPQELQGLKKHKKKPNQRFEMKPLPFWITNPETMGEEKHTKNPSNTFLDSEKKIHKIGKNLNDRFGDLKDGDSRKEILIKREELREIINLPVVRGKDPHVNDSFYQYLVERVCIWDVFGIFYEYSCAVAGVSEELQQKIDQVKGIINEVLENKSTFPQRREWLQKLADEYEEKWGTKVLLDTGDQFFAL